MSNQMARLVVQPTHFVHEDEATRFVHEDEATRVRQLQLDYQDPEYLARRLANTRYSRLPLKHQSMLVRLKDLSRLLDRSMLSTAMLTNFEEPEEVKVLSQSLALVAKPEPFDGEVFWRCYLHNPSLLAGILTYCQSIPLALALGLAENLPQTHKLLDAMAFLSARTHRSALIKIWLARQSLVEPDLVVNPFDSSSLKYHQALGKLLREQARRHGLYDILAVVLSTRPGELEGELEEELVVLTENYSYSTWQRLEAEITASVKLYDITRPPLTEGQLPSSLISWSFTHTPSLDARSDYSLVDFLVEQTGSMLDVQLKEVMSKAVPLSLSALMRLMSEGRLKKYFEGPDWERYLLRSGLGRQYGGLIGWLQQLL